MPRASRQASRPALIALTALFVLAFFGFSSSNALRMDLLSVGFYDGALEDVNAYERVYDEVAADPALSSQMESLTGDLDFPISELAGVIGGLVGPDLLREVVQETLTQFVEFIKDKRDLDLSIDVTGLLGGIGDFGLEAGSLLGGGQLDSVPERSAASYAQFKSQLQSVTAAIASTGEAPEFIPVFDVPRAQRQEVLDILTTAGKLDSSKEADRETIAAARESIADDEVGDAIRGVMSPLVKAKPAKPSAARTIGGQFIREERGPDGETRFLLGPPADVERDVEDALQILQTLNAIHVWLLPLSIIVGFGALAALGWFGGSTRARRLRWPGIALLSGGALAAIAWFVAKPIFRADIHSAAIPRDLEIAPSYRRLLTDILDQVLTNFGWSILIPALVAAGVGAMLVFASLALARSMGAPPPDDGTAQTQSGRITIRSSTVSREGGDE